MLQILQTYHAGSRVDGPPQVTVAPSFLIILLQKSSSPLQVPISSPLKEQCVAWCIRESMEPCFPYFPSRCRIASAYLVSVVDVAGRGVQLLYIPASNTTFILNTNLGLGLLN